MPSPTYGWVLPRIRWVKTFELLPDNINPKLVNIRRKSSKCFFGFKVER
ncbi:MAG: hypothetical protein O4861_09065 [Trichodesmium sp. St16_bin4-tuft]|nr:hypothetical protein [Trichodesmium sp. ALOHA_ZT_67]MCL2927068.1 hypothetical protein [Trichodesmium sp. MAG_R01]MDE5068358.1 hypothetical protein [Trichodesmium sp. St4_bin8_1]MDE5074400.1 hypothetical protein [Trichodesmium sp. St5_bin8]MDE5077958.1 hypothetical protein [Trichodesmium sp. St2_bin6]MDE5092083.1 hypothetical protein [Trichodesmium sp. St18_bin3_1_1]MDE5095573.1 hypothetical protein [Trichodesmium sp. St11_bin5]MDE5098474.1 hypothetical protein [Trichodesmium sp. St16_bin4